MQQLRIVMFLWAFWPQKRRLFFRSYRPFKMASSDLEKKAALRFNQDKEQTTTRDKENVLLSLYRR